MLDRQLSSLLNPVVIQERTDLHPEGSDETESDGPLRQGIECKMEILVGLQEIVPAFQAALETPLYLIESFCPLRSAQVAAPSSPSRLRRRQRISSNSPRERTRKR